MRRFPTSRLVRTTAFAALALAATSGCRIRESHEAVTAKARRNYLAKQIDDLKTLRAQAESGELVTTDQIAISVDEDVAQQILNASLPRDQPIGERAVIRIEKAEAFFRGNNAALLFQARVTSTDLPDQFAELELGGNLEDLKLVEGRLAGHVAIGHFSLRKASVGPLAQGLVENLVRSNLGLIQDAIPPFELPVKLDQQVKVDKFDAGPVSARGGELPLSLQVSNVIPISERLWILIKAKAGPWKPLAAAPSAPPSASASPSPSASPSVSPSVSPSPAAGKR